MRTNAGPVASVALLLAFALVLAFALSLAPRAVARGASDISLLAASRARPAAVETAAASVSAPVSATGLDNAHIELHWQPVVGAAGYRVFRDGLLVGATAEPAFTDALLWPATRYEYRVEALSEGGAPFSEQAVSAATTPLPPTGFPRPFAPDSIWNTPVGGAPLRADSASLAASFAAVAINPNITLHHWGVSVAEARRGDPLFSVPCTRYACTLDALGPFAIPPTAQADPSPDGHLAVYDPSSGREWSMWQARREGAGWSASAGAAVATSGNGIAPAGTASGDAANFPLLGGLIRPEEILQGHIDHALVFSLPGASGAAHVCPATHDDGSSDDPAALEEGSWVQLDPAVEVDSLPIPAWQQTIARAMQVYGMYLRDDGGSLAIMAENPISRGYDAWAAVGLGGIASASLAGIPWDRFRVLAPPC